MGYHFKSLLGCGVTSVFSTDVILFKSLKSASDASWHDDLSGGSFFALGFIVGPCQDGTLGRRNKIHRCI